MYEVGQKRWLYSFIAEQGCHLKLKRQEKKETQQINTQSLRRDTFSSKDKQQLVLCFSSSWYLFIFLCGLTLSTIRNFNMSQLTVDHNLISHIITKESSGDNSFNKLLMGDK